MPDHGARYTDEQIAELETRIAAMYGAAYKDIREKYTALVKQFAREDAEYRRKVKAGEISKESYEAWLRGQVFRKKRWEAQMDELAQTLTRTTQAAMDIINDAAPGVFAMNANYASYEIERDANIDMGFGLYDEDAVRRLVRDDPNLLPPSKVNTPLEQQWNRTLINRQIGVGIIAGEGIMAIAERLQRAASMSRNQALTHARTAMTGAQNAGRIEGYHRAEDMGIRLEKEWLATLDNHTRHAHAALDGQHVPVDEPFQSELGEIMYPGDPSARPANVYNCRCTLISRLLDYPSENAKCRPNLQKLGDRDVQKPIKDMTYAEWASWKEKNQQAEMYRKTKNTGVFAHLPERMSKKHIREVAKEYGIPLEGISIIIDADPEKLKDTWMNAGSADPQHIGRIYFYPGAFSSKEELTRTLFHEKIHVEQFKKFGAEYVQNNRRFFEDLAEEAELEFVERMRKKGKL